MAARQTYANSLEVLRLPVPSVRGSKMRLATSTCHSAQRTLRGQILLSRLPIPSMHGKDSYWWPDKYLWEETRKPRHQPPLSEVHVRGLCKDTEVQELTKASRPRLPSQRCVLLRRLQISTMPRIRRPKTDLRRLQVRHTTRVDVPHMPE